MYIEVTPQQHKKIKMLAVSRGQSLRQLFLDAIENLQDISCQDREHEFNAESEKALKKSESGKGATTHKTAEDLFKKYGI